MNEVIKVEDCVPNIGDYDILIHNAIIIPNNATNGDMMKAVFPKALFDDYVNPWDEVESVVMDDIIYFDVSWWNAPYKVDKESE